MGMMDWFKRIAGGAREDAVAVAAPADDKGAEVAGLNFKSAVDAHMRWKIRLETYINGTSGEDLKVEVVGRDDQCPLGKWIYSQGGGRFGYSETFFDMKAHHAHFHRCAGEVLAAAQAGEKDKAMRLLQQGDYVRASERVKKLLAKLFVLVTDGKTAIDAHTQWKTRLRDYISGSGTEDLEVAIVSRDDQCVLGRWLQADGELHHGKKPEFARVRSAHARFHEAAGEVLATAQRGDRTAALRMLDEGEYLRASDEVAEAIVALFKPA